LVGAHPNYYQEQLFKKTLQQCKVFFVFTTFVFDKARVLETFHFIKATKMDLVYILHSATLNRFYIGYTSDLDLRLEFHLNSNETRKFTSKATD
jgi:hypothetical protein